MIVQKVSSEQEMRAAFAIRRQVFIVEQAVPEDLEVDGLDPECTHLLARDGAVAVGTARMRTYGPGVAKAERVAVLEAWRGRGLGHLLMDALEAEAGATGHAEVVLYAQVQVVPFYRARGYAAEGPEFEEAGIAHQRMRKALAQRDPSEQT